ncbi:MAG: SurA N-terminal domain-containing protein [Proteobacteria bacterium]|nr:SurA N-terminal domain-containing protein [Pseudomonadota bacterium]MBU1739740.1 SurA N-terminal domain-containing protein [Pseudomonadota bacterium]
MKYVFSILLIAVIVTIMTTGFFLDRQKKPVADPAVVINDRIISTSELDEIYRNLPRPPGDRQQFIESLITRELLIQEAMKMGLDQEEEFRHSIQNFYAQSLTKILLERKFDSFRSNPSRQEIDRFLELQDFQVELTLLPVSNQPAGEKKHAGPFRELGTSLQVALLSVAAGEASRPILIDDREYTLRLDALTSIPPQDDPGLTPEEARKTILLDHQEQALDRWLQELRNQAEIRVAASAAAE